EQEEGDRGGEVHVLHVAVELNVGFTPDLIGEGLQGLGQALGAQRRTVQISDQRADAIGGVLLGLADLVELVADLRQVALLEKLPRDVDLNRKAEQHLRQVVVEVAGDLESLVGALFRDRVRQLVKHLLALLQLLVRLLQRERSEEHLSGEQGRGEKHWQRPKPNSNIELRDRETQDTKTQVAD